jgi:hypothetical protein
MSSCHPMNHLFFCTRVQPSRRSAESWASPNGPTGERIAERILLREQRCCGQMHTRVALCMPKSAARYLIACAPCTPVILPYCAAYRLCMHNEDPHARIKSAYTLHAAASHQGVPTLILCCPQGPEGRAKALHRTAAQPSRRDARVCHGHVRIHSAGG